MSRVVRRRRLKEFWLGDTEPYGAAAFRILFGLFLFCYFLSFAPDVELMFSDEGVYLPVILPDLAPPPLVAWVLYLTMLAVTLLFANGWRTRILTPLLLIGYFYYFTQNLAVKNTAYDRLILVILLLACFAELDGAWADRRPRREPNRIPALPVRMLGLQLAFLYLGSGLWKLVAPHWRSPDMLRQTLLGPWGNDLSVRMVQLGLPTWFWAAATASVVVFELVAGLAIFSRRTQKPVMLFGAMFHVGIAFLLSLPQFLVCITLYPVLLPPEQVRAAGERVARHFRRPRPAAPKREPEVAPAD